MVEIEGIPIENGNGNGNGNGKKGNGKDEEEIVEEGKVKTYPSRKQSFRAGGGKQLSRFKKAGLAFVDFMKSDKLTQTSDGGYMRERGPSDVEGITPRRKAYGPLATAGRKRVAEVKKGMLKKGAAYHKSPSSMMPSGRQWERTRRGGMAAVSTLTGVRLPGVYNPYAISKGKRGRPRGPSGKYVIPGKGAVSVYKYRKWASHQRKLSRLGRMQREYQERFEGDYDEPRRLSTMPVSGSRSDYYSNQVPRGQERFYAQERPQEQQYSQPRASFVGGPMGPTNALNSGRMLSPGPSILHAPNVFKGELRNVGEGGMDVRERKVNIPVVNPSGDEYLDVDPLSGEYILKKRPNEKWLSGKRRGMI